MHAWAPSNRSRFGRRLVGVLGMAVAIAGLTAPVTARSAGLGAALELVDPDVLRVCADPNNLPFSNEAGEGFENKLADLVAKKLGRSSVVYTYFPIGPGFVRHTLGAHLCDVVMGYAQGDELVQNTNPYYGSAYALVTRADSPLADVTTLSDPRLKGKHIGVVAMTPPATLLALNGLMADAKPFPLAVDTRYYSPVKDMIGEVANGTLDAAVAWGPMAGYYATKVYSGLKTVPLIHEPGTRTVFRITMGVRASDQEWKRTLNKVIRENQAAIDAILLDYGVPLLDEHDRPIGKQHS